MPADMLRALQCAARIVIKRIQHENSFRLNLLTPEEYGELYMQSRNALQMPPPWPVDDATVCRFAGTVSIGIREASGALCGEFSRDRCLGLGLISASRSLKEMVLARLQAPASKRRTV